MADHQVGNPLGLQAVGGKNINGGADDRTGFFDADMATIAAMRTRLTAISATAYSDANLNRMTMNDMMYALRVHDAAATVK